MIQSVHIIRYLEISGAGWKDVLIVVDDLAKLNGPVECVCFVNLQKNSNIVYCDPPESYRKTISNGTPFGFCVYAVREWTSTNSPIGY